MTTTLIRGVDNPSSAGVNLRTKMEHPGLKTFTTVRLPASRAGDLLQTLLDARQVLEGLRRGRDMPLNLRERLSENITSLRALLRTVGYRA